MIRLKFSLLCCLCLWAIGAHAQDDRTPIGWEARTAEFDRRIGDNVRRLIGDVVFTHEDTRMYCDSAYHYTALNSLRAYGNIHIQVSDTVNIYGDELFYNGDTRLAELSGRVRMRDPQMTLYTEFLEYDLDRNTANYPDGGRIVDADNELTSRWGFYFADQKEFFFKDDVVLVNPEYTMESDTLKYNTVTETAYFFGPTTILSDENIIFCRNGWYDTRNDIARFSRDAHFSNNEQSLTGDSIFYDRNRGYGRAENNVMLRDSVEQVIITGEFAEHFEREGLSVVTRRAMLTQVAENDSLFLHADTLKSVYDKDRDERRFLAYRHVRFYRSDLQGLADSVLYNMADSTIYLFHDPVLWSDNYQLTASKIEVKTSGDQVEQLRLLDAAFIVMQEDTLGFNQMKGRLMTGHFRDNELWRIDVEGNGESIFYIIDNDGQLVGINKAVSSDIVIFIDGAELTGIQFVRNPDAALYPPDELPPDDRKLRNFRWMDHRRPIDKWDIFVWR